MINININNVEYSVPQSWNDVSIGTFKKIQVITQSIGEKVETLIDLEVVAAFIGCSVDILMTFKKDDFMIIKDALVFSDSDIVKTNKLEFMIKGKKHLRILNLGQLTMGNTIDLENIIKDTEECDLIEAILPILIREGFKERRGAKMKPSEFSAEDYPANKELYRDNISIADAMFVMDFF